MNAGVLKVLYVLDMKKSAKSPALMKLVNKNNTYLHHVIKG